MLNSKLELMIVRAILKSDTSDMCVFVSNGIMMMIAHKMMITSH